MFLPLYCVGVYFFPAMRRRTHPLFLGSLTSNKKTQTKCVNSPLEERKEPLA